MKLIGGVFVVFLFGCSDSSLVRDMWLPENVLYSTEGGKLRSFLCGKKIPVRVDDCQKLISISSRFVL